MVDILPRGPPSACTTRIWAIFIRLHIKLYPLKSPEFSLTLHVNNANP